jgi:hypothetical protein
MSEPRCSCEKPTPGMMGRCLNCYLLNPVAERSEVVSAPEPSSVVKNKTTPENREFWNHVEKVAADVRTRDSVDGGARPDLDHCPFCGEKLLVANGVKSCENAKCGTGGATDGGARELELAAIDLVKAAVHLAILRHDLGDDDMDIDAILEDTANAVRGIDTCAEEPITEWEALRAAIDRRKR